MAARLEGRVAFQIFGLRQNEQAPIRGIHDHSVHPATATGRGRAKPLARERRQVSPGHVAGEGCCALIPLWNPIPTQSDARLVVIHSRNPASSGTRSVGQVSSTSAVHAGSAGRDRERGGPSLHIAQRQLIVPGRVVSPYFQRAGIDDRERPCSLTGDVFSVEHHVHRCPSCVRYQSASRTAGDSSRDVQRNPGQGGINSDGGGGGRNRNASDAARRSMV